MEKSIQFISPSERNGAKVLSFQDPDGIGLELITTNTPPADVQPWQDAPVPADYAIRGIYSVQLWVLESQRTMNLLQKLGYDILSSEGTVTRLTPKNGFGQIEVRATGQFLAAQGGVGTIHHIAFRVFDEAAQADMRKLVLHESISATTVQDRQYFRSIYFREPGGVLFEIATDSPGFAIDEKLEHLGEVLKLPSYLEPQREYIESVLPKLETREITMSGKQ
jgi:glyoxalase family protein